MFYAVHKGHKPGIYGNWLDCKKQIDKFDGAIFKKFDKKDDALTFVKDGFGGKMPRGLTRKTNSDKKNNDNIEDETLIDKSPKIFIYTDGSCIKINKFSNKAGFGIYIPEKNIRVGAPLLNQKLTNNRAEMTAIIDSIKYLDEDDLQKKLCIFTDSQYSIYIFTGTGERYEKNDFKNNGKDVPNIDLIKKALELKRKYNIVLLKVRAHTDKKDEHSIGNDIADKLANEGANHIDSNNNKKNLFEGDYFDDNTSEYVPLQSNSKLIHKNVRMNELFDITKFNNENNNLKNDNLNDELKDELDDELKDFTSLSIKSTDYKPKKTKYKSSKLSQWFSK